MDGDRDGFDHGRSVERQRLRQAVEDARGDGDEFGKCTVTPVIAARDAQHLAAVAEVDFAAPAEETRPTTHRGIEGHAIARRPAMNFAPRAGNYAGRFVTHDQRRNPAARRAVQTVYVAAADPAGTHPDQDIVRTGLGLREVGHFQLHVLCQQQRFHPGVPSTRSSHTLRRETRRRPASWRGFRCHATHVPGANRITAIA